MIAGTHLEGTPVGTVLHGALRALGRAREPYLTVGTFTPNIHGVGNPLPLRQLSLNVHSHILGQTGMGKSYHIISQLDQLLRQGIGFSFVDPNDTGERFFSLLVARGFFDNPEHRKRVRYVEFDEDAAWCLPLNFLNRPGVEPATIAEQMLKVFHRLWPALSHGAAPRFDDIMHNGMVVLIANQLPLTCMEQLLTNRRFRERLLSTMGQERYIDVVRFFRSRFDSWGRVTPEFIDSTLTRISTLLAAPILKYSIGQQEMQLNFRAIMDQEICVIYNLGRVQNEDVRRFLGCLLTKGYDNAAMSRQDLPHWSRRPHHLYIDEFHDFSENSSDSLSKDLTMGRKYGLFVCMAHQNWDQDSVPLQHAIETNASVKKAFRIGRSDAELSAKIMGAVDPLTLRHTISAEDSESAGMAEGWERWVERLMHLPRQHLLVKIGISPTQEVVSVPVRLRAAEPAKLEQVRQAFFGDLQKRRSQIQLVHFGIQPDGTIGASSRQEATPTAPPPVHPSRSRATIRLPWSVELERT